MRVGIIGGGAAGLMAGIFSKNNNNEVVILEKNSEVGKKILITGNGKCNYWNSDQNLSHYESSNMDLIEKLINQKNDDQVLEFFNSLGIVPKIKNGYYYPFSNQASTIRNVLLNKALDVGVVIKNNVRVINIEKKDNNFLVMTDNEDYYFDKVVIATGSKSSPITGSDGAGYNFLKDLGHSIIRVLPSLVQLEADEDFLNDWNGIRTDVDISLYVNDELMKVENGEIQLTNYGISGICVFNISNQASLALNKKDDVTVKINFMPFIPMEKCNDYLLNQTIITNKNIYDLLISILNNKLVNVIISRTGINKNKKFNELSELDKDCLIKCLCSFEINIVKTKSFNEA